ncbi:MAG: TerD family protein, partial [Bacteroidaceae bacterium]|nr:TerD family protein [Bacteroidaceae bacterium]
FARTLFSLMLQFGPQRVVPSFERVLPQLPMRLIMSLANNAEAYFSGQNRLVSPLSGGRRLVPPHPLLLEHYSADERRQMIETIDRLVAKKLLLHWSAQSAEPGKGLYIDPALDAIPLPVADRSNQLHDHSSALPGMRFPVEGECVRLFLQWGEGLPAQHLDLDLSAVLLGADLREECAFYNLAPEGARHSGDIRFIPDQVGTAEYVELHLPTLQARGIEQVAFTCNAYSAGSLSINARLGWMNAEHPMRVSETDGVAYDPSTVTHSCRVGSSMLKKGLLFALLDVAKRDILWLEMPFDGQLGADFDLDTLNQLKQRLENKITIGQLLRQKAEIQHATLVQQPDDAHEVYDLAWATDTAAMARWLLA